LSPERTIGAAQARARRALDGTSETPTLDSQMVLADLLGRPRSWVLAHPEFGLDPREEQMFANALARLADGVPLAYVLGWWEFYGRRFKLTPDVLIPRPETELLVEHALGIIRSDRRPEKVVEVGTGSGCIAVSLAAEVPELEVIATDVSDRALAVCRVNAQRHGVGDRVHLAQADSLVPFAGPIDLILANLPYIPSQVLEGLPVSRQEPKLALDGGVDGLEPLRLILGHIRRMALAAGVVLVEIGAGQGDEASAVGRTAFPSAAVRVVPDLAGRDRLLDIRVGREG
jgi:release factor glutamine methyltransferase